MITKTQLRSAAVALLLLVSAGAVQAQSRFGVDFRVGAAFPTDEVDSDELQTGFGFGANLTYRLMQPISLYAGWDWYHFTNDVEDEADEVDLEDTGYAFGVMLEQPVLSGVNVWALGGGLYKHVEMEDQDGEELLSTDHGFGFELGAGIAVAASERLSFKPGVRYRSFTSDVEVLNTTLESELKYVSVDLGISYRF